jgi:hypothetical protein
MVVILFLIPLLLLAVVLVMPNQAQLYPVMAVLAAVLFMVKIPVALEILLAQSHLRVIMVVTVLAQPQITALEAVVVLML